MNFNPFPSLKSERLVFRRMNENDVKQVFFLRSDPEVNSFVERPAPKNLDEALAFIKKINKGINSGQYIYWTITLQGNNSMIGSICLWNFSEDASCGEVGYDLHPDYQGKGYMNEALREILNYGFNQLNLARIEAFTHHKNAPSLKLLEKNGFQLVEGKMDEHNENNVVYQLNR